MPPKVKLILNPNADHERAWRVTADLRLMIEGYDRTDWGGTVYPTHAVEMARQAAEQGYNRILALGGDGTVHEIINGLMQVPQEKRPTLGIVPLGSGNDFAQTLGLSMDPREAMRRALTGAAKPLDVGRLQDEHGRSEYWNNTFGVGFDAVVTLRARRIRFVHGFLMYLVAVLQSLVMNFDTIPMSIQTETETWTQPTLMLALGNGRQEGGGFLVTPDARFDDGLFQYATIGRVSRLRMLRLIPEVMRGTHGRFKQVRMGICRQMSIRTESPVCVHLDGEVFAGFDSNVRQLDIEVVPNAIQLVY